MRGGRLGRPADQRKALLRALTTECIRHGAITTTLTKCKEVRKTVDHMVTLAKDGSLHARRQALGYIYDKQLVHALFEGVRAAPLPTNPAYRGASVGFWAVPDALPPLPSACVCAGR